MAGIIETYAAAFYKPSQQTVLISYYKAGIAGIRWYECFYGT
jgi:hypothetical protein